MSNRTLSTYRQRLKYVITDFITTSVAFFLFDICRFFILQDEIPSTQSIVEYLLSAKLILEQIFIPLSLLFIYWLSGYYNRPFDKSRLQEFITTFYSSLLNATLIFFILLINDRGPIVSADYLLIFVSFLLLLICTYSGRLILTTASRRYTRHKNIRTNLLIIGSEPECLNLYQQLINTRKFIKYNIVGFVFADSASPDSSYPLPCWCWLHDDIEAICRSYNIDQVVLAPDKSNNSDVLAILDRLFPLDIPVKIMPDTLSYLTSSIRLTDILGEPFIDLTAPPMSDCSANIKLTFDKIAASLALIILSPLFLALTIGVKISSPGPVFYRQERIGMKRKPFYIYKFRSMHTNAEDDGPMLSSSNDNRITPLGRIMRKYRLDELPQFWNVIKGDMSLVGPRPERDYFIKQIIKKAPYYCLVFQVKPGITSWGMVKFGYASDVSQMVERTKFDLIYITNMTIALDLKILIYTIRTIFMGSGL